MYKVPCKFYVYSHVLGIRMGTSLGLLFCFLDVSFLLSIFRVSFESTVLVSVKSLSCPLKTYAFTVYAFCCAGPVGSGLQSRVCVPEGL